MAKTKKTAEKNNEVDAVVDGMLKDADKVYPSEVMKDNGRGPVVNYQTEEDREKGDKQYECVVSDNTLTNKEGETGWFTVGVNGYNRKFPLMTPVTLYGFQIRALRSCKFTRPKVVYDENSRQLRTVGTEEAQRFMVQVNDLI